PVSCMMRLMTSLILASGAAPGSPGSCAGILAAKAASASAPLALLLSRSRIPRSLPALILVRGQGTEDREQATGDRGQGTGDRGQATGDRRQGTGPRSEVGRGPTGKLSLSRRGVKTALSDAF